MYFMMGARESRRMTHYNVGNSSNDCDILWYTVVYHAYCVYCVYCNVYRQWVRKFARISKKEAVAFCWISSECKESFLRSGSLMGSCREKGKEKGRGRDEGEIRGRRKGRREEDRGKIVNSQRD